MSRRQFVYQPLLTCLIVKLDRPVDLTALLRDVKLDLKLLLPHIITTTNKVNYFPLDLEVWIETFYFREKNDVLLVVIII